MSTEVQHEDVKSEGESLEQYAPLDIINEQEGVYIKDKYGVEASFYEWHGVENVHLKNVFTKEHATFEIRSDYAYSTLFEWFREIQNDRASWEGLDESNDSLIRVFSQNGFEQLLEDPVFAQGRLTDKDLEQLSAEWADEKPEIPSWVQSYAKTVADYDERFSSFKGDSFPDPLSEGLMAASSFALSRQGLQGIASDMKRRLAASALSNSEDFTVDLIDMALATEIHDDLKVPLIDTDGRGLLSQGINSPDLQKTGGTPAFHLIASSNDLLSPDTDVNAPNLHPRDRKEDLNKALSSGVVALTNDYRDGRAIFQAARVPVVVTFNDDNRAKVRDALHERSPATEFFTVAKANERIAGKGVVKASPTRSELSHGINSLFQIRNARGLSSVVPQLAVIKKARDKAIDKARGYDR